MSSKKNEKKEQPKQHEKKLKINTSLDDVLKVSVPKKKKDKQKYSS